MISALESGELDVAIGLTEGWVAGLGKREIKEKEEKENARLKQQKEGAAPPAQDTAEKKTTKRHQWKMVGTYVETPLCWAISTGAKREDLVEKGVPGLEGGKIGISRFGR